jgi:S1-C subfamily serine protease
MVPTRIIVRPLWMIALPLLFLTSIAETKTADEVNNIAVYRKVSPGVVNISSVTVRHDFFYRAVPQEGTGSGAIIDRKGYIVTNHHVIHNAQSLEVTLTDGSKWPAKFVGADPARDLAVIKIDVPDRELTVISMGSSRDLKVGQKVLAIGNPFGLGQTLTTGVISSLDRSIRTNTDSVLRNLIQTDAAINPGNSGGPLLNSRGEIIGINTAILSPTGANVGIGFGIPVDVVKKRVPWLIYGRFFSYVRPFIFYALLAIFAYLFWRKVIGFRNERRE